MSKKADEKVMKLRKELLKKKEALLGTEKPIYIAGEYFRPNINFQRDEFKVSSGTKVSLLLGVKELLLHKQACTVLNMNSNYLGFTVKEWFADFLTRKSVIDRMDNLKEVNSIEIELKKLLSQAQLREIGIDDIADAIASV